MSLACFQTGVAPASNASMEVLRDRFGFFASMLWCPIVAWRRLLWIHKYVAIRSIMTNRVDATNVAGYFPCADLDVSGSNTPTR